MNHPKPNAVNLQINGVYLSTPTAINDFHLTDHLGNTFTKANLQGQWTLLFFGFTNCGMVCPTTMAALNGMYKTLQAQLPPNELPKIVFVSIDPERDTVKRLNEFINAYNPSFIGARASIEDTETLMKQFHIVSAKMQADGPGKARYTLDHTAEIFVVNPEAKLQASLAFPAHADQLVNDYKSILISSQHDPLFTDTTGNPVQLSGLKGKWVIVNYWATWCDNCIAEMRELNQFHKHNQNKNIVLYGVNYDRMSPDEIKKAMSKIGVAFPVITSDPNQAWHLGDISAIPMTFIIDPNGKVVKSILGPNTEKSLSKTLKSLQNA